MGNNDFFIHFDGDVDKFAKKTITELGAIESAVTSLNRSLATLRKVDLDQLIKGNPAQIKKLQDSLYKSLEGNDAASRSNFSGFNSKLDGLNDGLAKLIQNVNAATTAQANVLKETKAALRRAQRLAQEGEAGGGGKKPTFYDRDKYLAGRGQVATSADAEGAIRRGSKEDKELRRAYKTRADSLNEAAQVERAETAKKKNKPGGNIGGVTATQIDRASLDRVTKAVGKVETAVKNSGKDIAKQVSEAVRAAVQKVNVTAVTGTKTGKKAVASAEDEQLSRAERKAQNRAIAAKQREADDIERDRRKRALDRAVLPQGTLRDLTRKGKNRLSRDDLLETIDELGKQGFATPRFNRSKASVNELIGYVEAGGRQYAKSGFDNDLGHRVAGPDKVAKDLRQALGSLAKEMQAALPALKEARRVQNLDRSSGGDGRRDRQGVFGTPPAVFADLPERLEQQARQRGALGQHGAREALVDALGGSYEEKQLKERSAQLREELKRLYANLRAIENDLKKPKKERTHVGEDLRKVQDLIKQSERDLANVSAREVAATLHLQEGGSVQSLPGKAKGKRQFGVLPEKAVLQAEAITDLYEDKGAARALQLAGQGFNPFAPGTSDKIVGEGPKADAAKKALATIRRAFIRIDQVAAEFYAITESADVTESQRVSAAQRVRAAGFDPALFGSAEFRRGFTERNIPVRFEGEAGDPRSLAQRYQERASGRGSQAYNDLLDGLRAALGGGRVPAGGSKFDYIRPIPGLGLRGGSRNGLRAGELALTDDTRDPKIGRKIDNAARAYVNALIKSRQTYESAEEGAEALLRAEQAAARLLSKIYSATGFAPSIQGLLSTPENPTGKLLNSDLAAQDALRQDKIRARVLRQTPRPQVAEAQLQAQRGTRLIAAEEQREQAAKQLASIDKRLARVRAKVAAAEESALTSGFAGGQANADYAKAKRTLDRLEREQRVAAQALHSYTEEVNARLNGSGRGAGASSLLTQEAYDATKARRAELAAGRGALVDRVSAARDEGDLKENAGYHAAREELAKLDGALRQLDNVLASAQIGTKQEVEALNKTLAPLKAVRLAELNLANARAFGHKAFIKQAEKELATAQKQLAAAGNVPQRRGVLEPYEQRVASAETAFNRYRQQFGSRDSTTQQAKANLEEARAALAKVQAMSPKELGALLIAEGKEAEAKRSKKVDQVLETRAKGSDGQGYKKTRDAEAVEAGGKKVSGIRTELGALKEIVAAVNRVNTTLKGGVRTTGGAVSQGGGAKRPTYAQSLSEDEKAKRDSLLAERRSTTKEVAALKKERDKLATQDVTQLSSGQKGARTRRLNAIGSRLDEVYSRNAEIDAERKKIAEDAVKREIANRRTEVTQTPTAGAESAKRSKKKAQQQEAAEVQQDARLSEESASLSRRIRAAKGSVTKAQKAEVAAQAEADAAKGTPAAASANKKLQTATERLAAARNRLANLEGDFAARRATVQGAAVSGRGGSGGGGGQPPAPPGGPGMPPGGGEWSNPWLRGVRNASQQVTETVNRTGRQAFATNSDTAGAMLALYGRNGFWSRVVASTGTFIVRNFTAGFVFGATNALQQVVAQAIETESTFVRVSAALEAGDKELGNIRGDLAKISTDYGTNLNDVYMTAAQLTGLFETAPEIAAATKVSSQLQVISAGALNAAEAVTTLASITGAYQERLEKFGGGNTIAGFNHLADVFTSIQNTIGSNIEVTTEGLASISGLANELGLSLEEAGVYTAQIAKLTGSTGAAAGDKFTRILGAFQTGRGQSSIQQAYQQGGNGDLTPEAVTKMQAALNKGDIGSVLRNLLGDWDNLSTAQQRNIAVTIAGQRQAAAFQALFSQNTKVLNAVEKAANDTGAAEKRMNEITKTLRVQIQKLQSNITNLVQAFVRSGILNFLGVLLQVTNKVLGTVNSVLEAFNKFAESNDALKFIRDMGVGLLGLILMLRLLRSGLTGLGGAIGRQAAASGAVLGGRQAAFVAAAASGGGLRRTAGALVNRPGAVQYIPAGGTFANPATGLNNQAQARFIAPAGAGRGQQFLYGLGNFATRPGGSFSRLGLRLQEMSRASSGAAQGFREAQARVQARGYTGAGYGNAAVGQQRLAAAQMLAGNTALRAGAAIGKFNASGLGLTAGLIAVTYAVGKYREQLAKEKELRDKIAAADYGGGNDKTGKKAQDEKEYVGPFQEAVDEGTYDPNSFTLGARVLGSGLKGLVTFKNPFKEAEKSARKNLGLEAEGNTQYGITEANKMMEGFNKTIASSLEGAGASAEEVTSISNQINEEIDKKAQQVQKDVESGKLTEQQGAAKLGALEQVRKQVKEKLDVFAAQAIGLSASQILNADQVNTINRIIALGKTFGGRGTQVGTVDFSGVMKGLLEKTGISADDPIYGQLQAFAEGRATIAEQIKAEELILAAEVQRLQIKLQGLEVGSETYTETSAALQTAMDSYNSFFAGEVDQLLTFAQNQAQILQQRGQFGAATNQFGAALKEARARVEAGKGNQGTLAFDPDRGGKFLEGYVPEATEEQQNIDKAKVNQILQAITEAEVAKRVKNLKEQLARTLDPAIRALLEKQIADITLQVYGEQIDRNGQGAVSYDMQENAEAAATQAQVSYTQSRSSEISAQYGVKIASAGTNALAVAKLQLAQANATAALFEKGSVEYMNATASAIAAQYAVNAAIGQIAEANANLRAAYANAKGDPVGAARAGLQAAKAALFYAKKAAGGARTAEVINAQAQVVNAEAAVQQAKLDDQQNTIDFNLQMGKITAAGAIAALTNILKTEKLNRLQRQALLLKIKGLKDELSSDGQFNFGDIKLPTPYSVKRYIAQQKLDRQKALAAAAGYSDKYDVGAFRQGGYARGLSVGGSSSTVTNTQSATVLINGADTGKIIALIKQIVGGNVTVSTVQSRRN